MPLTAQPPWVLITVEGILPRVLDVTVSGVQSALGTNGQELTGAWRHIQATGQEAPTQPLDAFVIKVAASRPFGFHPAKALRTVSASRFSPIGFSRPR